MVFFVVLALVGIVSIITRSYIMQTIREKAPGKKLRYMLNCPQCSGFWVGLFYGVYDQFYGAWSIGFRNYVSVLLWGGLVSLSASVIIPLMDYVSFAKTDLVNKIARSGDSDDDDE